MPKAPPSDLRQVFAANVLQARDEARMTQRALSDVSGVSQKHISLIEVAGSNVGLDTVAQLAKALGKTPAQLLTPPRSSRR